MIFVFEDDLTIQSYNNEWDCLLQIGNELHIGDVVEKYSSEEIAKKAFDLAVSKIHWAFRIDSSQKVVAIHAPTEQDLKDEGKQIENPLYTMVVYSEPCFDYELQKCIKSICGKKLPLIEMAYVIQGNTVEDLENGFKFLDNDEYYTLFENLRYKEIGSGEVDFGEIENEIEKFERKKKRTYCKWEQEKDAFHIKTNCSSDAIAIGTDLLSKIKYCPCCGRKIKFIGEDQ